MKQAFMNNKCLLAVVAVGVDQTVHSGDIMIHVVAECRKTPVCKLFSGKC